jgi:hypothetical protein
MDSVLVSSAFDKIERPFKFIGIKPSENFTLMSTQI